MSNHKNTALVHFSGGSDSTLAAAFCAQRFDKVHLITYDRFSFIGARNYTLPNFHRLCRIYGKEKFERRVIPIEKWHKWICYDHYLHFAREYKLAVTSLSFCKLAMHWFSCFYGIENGINTVCDGMVPYMDIYPDQNKTISLDRLKEFYQKFGITYANPVYETAEDVEQRLYDMGIIETPCIRGTERDKQVYYAEQVVFALFLKYYIDRHGKQKYEKVLSDLFKEKISRMETALEDWRKNPKHSLIDRLRT